MICCFDDARRVLPRLRFSHASPSRGWLACPDKLDLSRLSSFDPRLYTWNQISDMPDFSYDVDSSLVKARVSSVVHYQRQKHRVPTWQSSVVQLRLTFLAIGSDVFVTCDTHFTL